MRRSFEFRLRRLERRSPPARAAPCRAPLPDWLLERWGYRYDRESERMVRLDAHRQSPDSHEWIESRWGYQALRQEQ